MESSKLAITLLTSRRKSDRIARQNFDSLPMQEVEIFVRSLSLRNTVGGKHDTHLVGKASIVDKDVQTSILSL